MARDILTSKGNVVHEATHDLESFIWVLSYCVMRNLQTKAFSKDATEAVKAQRNELKKLFVGAFAQTTAKKILAARNSACTALIFPKDEDISEIIAAFMGEHLITLFRELEDLVWSVSKPSNPGRLTHDDLLEVVDKGITSLEYLEVPGREL